MGQTGALANGVKTQSPFTQRPATYISANRQASMAAAAAAHLAAQEADALPQRLQHIVKGLDAVRGCTEEPIPQGRGRAARSRGLLEACSRAAAERLRSPCSTLWGLHSDAEQWLSHQGGRSSGIFLRVWGTKEQTRRQQPRNKPTTKAQTAAAHAQRT